MAGKKRVRENPEKVKAPEAKVSEVQAPGVYRYRCTEPCTFLKRYRGAGDIVELSEKRDVPHFELLPN